MVDTYVAVEPPSVPPTPPLTGEDEATVKAAHRRTGAREDGASPPRKRQTVVEDWLQNDRVRVSIIDSKSEKQLNIRNIYFFIEKCIVIF